MATIGYIGDELDLIIRQGGTFGPYRLTIRNPDGTPVNLQDAVFRGQIRKSPDALTVDASFIFSVTNPLQGKVEFEIDAVSTAAIMSGLSLSDEESNYVYDIEYVNEVNRVLPLLYGKVFMFREVTK